MADGRAVCQVCGPVDVVKFRRTRWQCKNKAEEEKAYDKQYAKTYATEATRARKRELYHEKHWKVAIATRYKVDPDWYDRTLEEQGGVCAICKKDRPNGWGKYPVDHDHKTGDARGLLCGTCNSLIGFAGEDTAVLERAIEYLRRFRC